MREAGRTDTENSPERENAAFPRLASTVRIAEHERTVSRRDDKLSSDAVFTATHWSVVLAAAQTTAPDASEALEKLCRIYSPPLMRTFDDRAAAPTTLSTLRRSSSPRFLQRKHVKLADPQSGRFRSFLITALKNFLISEWRRGHAEKRGGGQWLLSLDELSDAETRFTAASRLTSPDARPGV